MMHLSLAEALRIDDSPINLIFADMQPEALSAYIIFSSHPATKCQSQLECRSLSQVRWFNPVGSLDGGQEVSTLDLPLPGASPLALVVLSDFQGGERSEELSTQMCNFGQVCSEKAIQRAWAPQSACSPGLWDWPVSSSWEITSELLEYSSGQSVCVYLEPWTTLQLDL